MTATPTTITFDVTLEDLLYAEGAAGLNDILDQRLGQNPEYDGIIATDISYEAVSVSPGDIALITISATFTSDYLYGEPDEDSEDGMES